MADTQRAPRVEACIQEAMEKYAGGSPGRDLTYYQNVHQDLAPLARELENALSVAKARIAELERATPQSPSTAPEVDDLLTYPSPHGTLVRLADVKCRIASHSCAALASRPAEVDDSQLRNVAQFLLDRYDEMRNKKGAPSTAEFELLRLALAPSHTTNKEKGGENGNVPDR